MTTTALDAGTRRAELYRAVSDFAARGWSLIPLSPQTKRPTVKWKPYQTERAEERQLRSWFLHRGLNAAVVFGAVSGGLCSRDFDDVAEYDRWAAHHPDLAATLPTVETRRGRHVYFRAEAEAVRELRIALGRDPDRIGALVVAGGELRCGVGCYSVIPPSTHPSGFVYRWLIEPAESIPLVDPQVFL